MGSFVIFNRSSLGSSKAVIKEERSIGKGPAGNGTWFPSADGWKSWLKMVSLSSRMSTKDLQSIYKHILIILFQQQRVSVLRVTTHIRDVPGIDALIRQLTCPHFV
jgi:hypothetical protein